MKGAADGADAAADAEAVDEELEDEETWLTGAADFSIGRPCRSK